jgi:phosphoenolpyruvate carboxylase
VESEVAWGLHFFRETLFERTPHLCETLQTALNRHYPEITSRVKPPLRYSSWIGGDRDGNPFVTVATTRNALAQNRSAAIERLSLRLADLARLISISAYEISFTDDFKVLLDEQLDASASENTIIARNPTEPFRQYFSALNARLLATNGEGPAKPFASLEEFIDLLMKAEAVLVAMNIGSMAASLVRPVRWEAEIFGFRTVRFGKN